jgi:hypothetical protein
LKTENTASQRFDCSKARYLAILHLTSLAV